MKIHPKDIIVKEIDKDISLQELDDDRAFLIEIISTLKECIEQKIGQINNLQIRNDLIYKADMPYIVKQLGGKKSENLNIVNMENENKRIMILIDWENKEIPVKNEIPFFHKIKNFIWGNI